MKELSLEETKAIVGGEALALATVMAFFATAIVAVICYKLFISTKGSGTIPGGWKFTWN